MRMDPFIRRHYRHPHTFLKPIRKTTNDLFTSLWYVTCWNRMLEWNIEHYSEINMVVVQSTVEDYRYFVAGLDKLFFLITFSSWFQLSILSILILTSYSNFFHCLITRFHALNCNTWWHRRRLILTQVSCKITQHCTNLYETLASMSSLGFLFIIYFNNKLSMQNDFFKYILIFSHYMLKSGSEPA